MKSQDIKEIRKFTEQFENKFKSVLNTFPDTLNEFRDYLGYGADSIYTTPKPKDFKETNWLRSVERGMIWVSTGINPHGITSKEDIGRTYTIKFEQKCVRRHKWHREWHTDVLYHFYAYGRTIDEVMAKFQEYINQNLK